MRKNMAADPSCLPKLQKERNPTVKQGIEKQKKLVRVEKLRQKNNRKRNNKKKRDEEESTRLAHKEIPTTSAPIENCPPPSKSSTATVAVSDQSLLQENQHKKQENPILRPPDEIGARSSSSFPANTTLDGPSFLSIPDEMQHKILSYLSYTEVSALREVRKT